MKYWRIVKITDTSNNVVGILKVYSEKANVPKILAVVANGKLFISPIQKSKEDIYIDNMRLDITVNEVILEGKVKASKNIDREKVIFS